MFYLITRNGRYVAKGFITRLYIDAKYRDEAAERFETREAAEDWAARRKLIKFKIEPVTVS